MTEASAVILTDRPPSGPPSFPPPTTPPLPPPGGWYSSPPVLPPKRRRTGAALVAAALLVVAGATVIGLESRHSGSSSASATKATTVTPTPTPTKATPGETLPTVSSSPATAGPALSTDAIVSRVDPAVVDITTTVDGGRAAGTGMVLTSSGLVLTNNHVIDGATTVGVQIAGTGPIHAAHVLGYDPTADVALLQIDNVSGLKTINVGDSSSLSVGDSVVTIGNALGSAGPHAVSTGSIDALDQTITVNDLTGSAQSLSGLIQLDAPLQPGDSGGPLVDSTGHVIGMDTAASASRRRTAPSRVGYAIPIAKALDISRQIQAGKGSATIHVGDRAILGIQVTVGDSSGVLGAAVAEVSPGGPAAGAGMQRGATITAIGATSISSVDDLGNALFTAAPGDKVKVTWTDIAGTSHSATVQLIAGPPA
jgi:S1-C subfamily serine protease